MSRDDVKQYVRAIQGAYREEFNEDAPPIKLSRNTETLREYAATMQRRIVDHRVETEERIRREEANARYEANRRRVDELRQNAIIQAGLDAVALPDFVPMHNIYQGWLQSYRLNNMHNDHPIFAGDLPSFLDEVRPGITNVITRIFNEHGSMKVAISGYVNLARGVDGVDNIVTLRFPLFSGTIQVLERSRVPTVVQQLITKLVANLEKATHEGSGWRFINVDEITIQSSVFVPRGGAKYVRPLDKCFRNKGCLSVQNNDDMCFKWAVLASLHYDDVPNDRQRVSMYKQWENELNFEGIQFPMTIDDIDLFEELNEDIAVHVMTYTNDTHLKVVKQRISTKGIERRQEGKETRFVVLLLDEEHFVCVYDVAALLKHQINKSKHTYIHCMYCMNFVCEKGLPQRMINHQVSCVKGGNTIEIIPNKGEFVSYNEKDYKKKQRIYFAIHVDLECFPQKISERSGNTHKYRVHTPSGYGFKVTTNYPHIQDLFPEEIYSGPDAVPKFIARLFELSNTLFDDYINKDVGMIWTDDMWPAFNAEVNCHICEKELGDDRVRDHDHIDGHYRGAAHNKCNINFNMKNSFIPVIFHNLKGYDSHFIITELAKYTKNLKVIAQSGEKFISFGTKKLRFLDSYQFMSCSLSDLVFNLTGRKAVGDHEDVTTLAKDIAVNALPKFKHLGREGAFPTFDGSEYTISNPLNMLALNGIYYKGKWFKPTNEPAPPRKAFFTLVDSEGDPTKQNISYETYKQVLHYWNHPPIPFANPVNLLTCKGIFCYEWSNSFARFDHPELPSKDDFYNKLNGESCSIKDYARAQLVWDVFGMTKFKHYHDLYLKGDVLQLSDVMDTFRDVCIQENGIDPCWSYTLPGYSWTAMLKATHAKLGLIYDSDMYKMIEDNKRGGYSCISRRLAKANNPSLPGYDPSKPTTWILTVDANNLYGHAMRRYLPDDSGEWVDKSLITVDFLNSLNPEGEHCYLVECDLIIPRELHKKFNDYPPGFETIAVDPENHSDYQKKVRGEIGKPTPKLLGTLYNKTKYLVHSTLLQYYLELGVQLGEVHRVAKFHQSPWLKPYIDANTAKRRAAGKNEFLRALYKLLNNSIFGRTLMNVRKHRDMRFVSSGTVRDPRCALKQKTRYGKLTASPFYERSVVIDEDHLVAVHMKKSQVKLDQPIQAGFSILELSKEVMYRFHYGVIQKKYGDKARLLFTDTDSLTYIIETESLPNDLETIKEHFDFSNYSDGSDTGDLTGFYTPHPLYSTTNKDVVGLFKDEAKGFSVSEFVGPRSKMYSLLIYLKNKRTWKYEFNNDKKVAKGINKCVTNKISHERYVDCVMNKPSYTYMSETGEELVFNPSRQTDVMHVFQSKNQRVTQNEVVKVSISCMDDKRYIEDCGIITNAYGYNPA